MSIIQLFVSEITGVVLLLWSVFLYMQDALKFGRPGYGAPVRTKSGRLRTSITGNPEIRSVDRKYRIHVDRTGGARERDGE